MILADFTFADWVSDAANWVFVVIAAAMLYSAFRVVTSSNVVHAVLFLFGIMITRAPLGTEPELDHPRRWPAALVALFTFGVLTGVMIDFGDSIGAEEAQIPEGIGRTGELGRVLFERFVIPFEVVSVLLLAALIGGIVLARRDPEADEEAA